MSTKQFIWLGQILIIIALAVSDKAGMGVKHVNLSMINGLRKELTSMEEEDVIKR